MIPLNAEVTISHTKPDKWGVATETHSTTHKAFQNYKMDVRGNEVNTRNSTLESLPIGYLMFHGVIQISQDDTMHWTGLDGRKLFAKPEDIKFITDLSGKTLYTKVTF